MQPKIFVGTYGKYNRGDISGKWFKLIDYADKSEFLRAAEKFHDDDPDPELMFLDWRDVPSWAIEESYISDEFWTFMENIDDDDIEPFNVYANSVIGDSSFEDVEQLIEDFKDAYQGEYKNMAEFAEDYVDDVGFPDDVSGFFDQQKFIRDIKAEGYFRADIEDSESSPETYDSGPGVYDNNGEYTGYRTIPQMVNDWFQEGQISNEEIESKYFDFEKYGRDLEFGGDFIMVDKYVFRRD